MITVTHLREAATRHAGRVEPLLRKLATRRFREEYRRPLVVLGIVVVTGGAWISVDALALDLRSFRWERLSLALILGVLLIPLNAEEYRLSARVARLHMDTRQAMRITVIATLANFLPIPAGKVVRVERLVSGGAGARTAVLATAFVGVIWLLIATLLGAVTSLVRGGVAVAVVLGSIALVATVVAAIVWWTRPHRLAPTLAGKLVAVEIGFLVVSIVRIYLAGTGIGLDVDAAQAVMLAVASVLAVTIGVLPAGLGIWEGLSAILAPSVGLAASAGFLVAAAVRLLTLAVYSVAGAVIATRSLREGGGSTRDLDLDGLGDVDDLVAEPDRDPPDANDR